MKAAFYDFDGTLASSNVVTRHFCFARRTPALLDRWRRSALVVGGIPYWLALDAVSRARFNRVFYGLYRGMSEEWLRRTASEVFTDEIRPKLYAGSQALLDGDRADGYQLVLVTGGLDFVIEPVARYFGFDHVLANRMEFVGGVASGRLLDPLLAEQGKVEALDGFRRSYNVEVKTTKAYSDSFSDLPMLESVELPTAVNPDKKLRRLAEARSWPILRTRP